MASFGENLRREREMRGVSLQEIAAATKISVRFLEAVENQDFGKLPGGIFTRSFIRTYAKYLGLDEEAVLAEYQLVAQPRADLDLRRLTISSPVPPPQSARTPVVALLVAAVLLASGYALSRYSRRGAALQGEMPSPARVPPAPATSPSQAAPSPPAAPAADASGSTASTGHAETTTTSNPPDAPAPAADQASQPSPVPRGVPASEGLVLQIAATERAWVAIEADGKTTLQRVLVPNEIQTLRAKNSFDVTTGNAQGIILTLNGETLKPLGRRGEVKSVHLTHDDLKNSSP